MQNTAKKAAFLYFSEYFSCSRGKKEIETLSKFGIDVDVYAFNSGSLFNAERESSRAETIYRFPIFLFTRKYRVPYLSRLIGALCFFLWLLVKSLSYSTLHLHSPSLLPVAIAAKLFRGVIGKKTHIVYDCHEIEWAKTGVSSLAMARIIIFERLFIKLCDVVMTVSEEITLLYKQRYKINNVETVCNFPNLTIRFSGKEHSSLRSDFSIPDDAIIFVYVGRLTKTRGIEEWLEAVSALDESDKTHFVIIGYGPLYDYCEEFALNHNNIHLKDVMDQYEMVSYIQGADYGINTPSLTSQSRTLALPNKLFEYMSAGLKTIVSDHSFRAEFARKYGCGIVIEAGDVSCITKLLKQPIAPVSQATRKEMMTLSQSFSWNSQEGVLARIYKINS